MGMARVSLLPNVRRTSSGSLPRAVDEAGRRIDETRPDPRDEDQGGHARGDHGERQGLLVAGRLRVCPSPSTTTR